MQCTSNGPPSLIAAKGNMREQQIALSLIMATLGRTDPIITFLDALRQQDVERVELLIVDQNDDDRVERLLRSRNDAVTIRRIHARPGLSHARNIGVAHARGELLGFPDDDCWYTPGLLRKVLEWFDRHPDADGLSCMVSDEHGRWSVAFMPRRSQPITRRNVCRSVNSSGLFVRRHVHAAVGGFDERLGVGAATPWGSAEETDYVMQALRSGCAMHYDAELRVIHPRRTSTMCKAEVLRSWRYGQGVGYVLRKNGYGFAAAVYFTCLPLASVPWALLRGQPGRAMERIVTSAGRMSGWIRGRSSEVTSRSPRAVMLPVDAVIRHSATNAVSNPAASVAAAVEPGGSVEASHS